MKRIAVVLALLASAAVVRADDAAALFSQKCAVCHGKDGKGTPAGLKMGAKDLTALKLSQDEIVKDIANGEGKMPAFKGKLSDEQIQSLAKYVKAGLK
jgi:cytochrome c6